MPIIEWNKMIILVKNYNTKIFYHVVKQELLEKGGIKCNTDRSCKGNLGLGSYGFLLRNKEGDLMYAQCENIGLTTNVITKMRAIVEAIKYCLSKTIRRVQLELDSLLMVNIINGSWKVPWEITEQLD